MMPTPGWQTPSGVADSGAPNQKGISNFVNLQNGSDHGSYLQRVGERDAR